MANTAPLPNIPTISAEEIHANNLRAFRIGNKARFALNQGLRALCGNGLLDILKYTSISEYAKKHFGFGHSLTMESIRVAEVLDSLPLCAARFQSGATYWSAISAITRIAKPETEERWLEFAKDKTIIQIEDEVQDAIRTGRDLPRKNHQGLTRPKVRVIFELEQEEYELLKKSFSKTRREMRGSMDRDFYPNVKEVFLFQARIMLTTNQSGVPEGRVDRKEPAESIHFIECPGCGKTELMTDEGPVSVPSECVERVKDRAKKVVTKPEKEVEGQQSESEPPAIDRPTPRSLREKVLLRGGHVCANPFCRRKLDLQVDHLVERSKGGRTTLANLNPLCKRCHSLKSLGLLIIRKNVDGTLSFERSTDRLTARVLKEAEEELLRIPRLVATVPTVSPASRASTRVDDEIQGIWGDQAQRAILVLVHRMGIPGNDAVRRLEAALQGFEEARKRPTDHELIQEALNRG